MFSATGHHGWYSALIQEDVDLKDFDHSQHHMVDRAQTSAPAGTRQRLSSVFRQRAVYATVAAIFTILLCTWTFLVQSYQGRPGTNVLGGLPWDPSTTRGLEEEIPLESKMFPRGLGKDLVILDIDNREWMREEAVNMSQDSWGRLNHYLYGLSCTDAKRSQCTVLIRLSANARIRL